MTTKEKIISAAIDVFSDKGKFGMRMEEVAKKAGINKAMLYYYYSTKDNLYHEVLSFILTELHNKIHESISGFMAKTRDHIEKIKGIAMINMRVFKDNPKYTKIMLEALANEPAHYMEIMSKNVHYHDKCSDESDFSKMYEEGVKAKVFRPVDTKNLMVSLMGMNMIYFAAKPVAAALCGVDVRNEEKFLNKRQESIIDLLLYGIMNKK